MNLSSLFIFVLMTFFNSVLFALFYKYTDFPRRSLCTIIVIILNMLSIISLLFLLHADLANIGLFIILTSIVYILHLFIVSDDNFRTNNSVIYILSIIVSILVSIVFLVVEN